MTLVIGGLLVNSLLALWLICHCPQQERCSFAKAFWEPSHSLQRQILARCVGLVNTMVLGRGTFDCCGVLKIAHDLALWCAFRLVYLHERRQ